MDFFNTLATDNSPTENSQVLKQILTSDSGPTVENFSAHKFDEVFDELKFSIIVAGVAIIIFMPFFDKFLNEIGIKSISALLVKAAAFIIIHYILLKKIYKA